MQAVLEEWRELEQQWRLEREKTLPGTAVAAAAAAAVAAADSLELSLATPGATATGRSTPATAMTSAEGSGSRLVTPSGQRRAAPKAPLLDLNRSLKTSRIARAGSEPASAATPRAAGQVLLELPGGEAEYGSQASQMLTVTPAAYMPPGSASNRSTSSTAGAVSSGVCVL